MTDENQVLCWGIQILIETYFVQWNIVDKTDTIIKFRVNAYGHFILMSLVIINTKTCKSREWVL
jgi:hypothetical protein